MLARDDEIKSLQWERKNNNKLETIKQLLEVLEYIVQQQQQQQLQRTNNN